jgi:transposase
MGKKSVRTYKSKIIYFTKKSIRNLNFNTESKEFEFSLFNIPMSTNLGKDKSDNMTILARVLSGEYQIGDSNILIDKNKFFLLLVVKSPKKEISPELLDSDISVGIDLGIENPVFITSTKDKWGKQIGNKKALFHKKISYRKQRTALQKTISVSAGGHGYKTKMRKLEDIKKAESNYTKTLFHTISKQVVDYAINQRAKIIKMEFLEGISEEESKIKSLVSFWAPRELQNLIQQKAQNC